jgi:hypothetical protein
MSPRWGSTPRLTDWLTDWLTDLLTDRQSQCDFDFDLIASAVENSDHEISVVHRITERTGRLENWIEFWSVGSPRWLNKKWQEDFIVIWSDSSCVKICCQETNSEDIVKA